VNLFSLINRGVKLSGGSQLDKALEATRAQWLDRLCTDEIRAWMNVGTVDREALTAINFLFSAAAMCSIHDTRQIDSPDARVIVAHSVHWSNADMPDAASQHHIPLLFLPPPRGLKRFSGHAARQR